MSNVENLSPQIIRRVAREMQELSEKPLEGIKVIVNECDITDIQAYIDGPGIYQPKLHFRVDFLLLALLSKN